MRSTIQRLGKTSNPTAVGRRPTISIVQHPVLAAAPRGLRPLIAAVAVNALNEREQTTRAAVEHQRHPVAILNVGGMHRHAQQETERIDEDVALATADLLARIEALRVEHGPPFCAPLALWLSMIAVVGLASRPACSRTAT